MHNVLGQSKQMNSSLDVFVFVRVYLICLIRFSTKNKIKTHVQDSHIKCSDYLVNIFTITVGCICLVVQ